MTKRVILCVDDEETVLRSLKRELSEALGSDYLIETADGGEDALEVVAELVERQAEFPVVISDHLMLDMKGDELLRRIHTVAPKTLTIMLTGHADMTAVTNAVNHANLYRYIAKPWEKTDLILTVKEALHKYVQEEKLAAQNLLLQDMNQFLEQQIKERTAELEVQKVELKQKNDQLKELNASKDKFFSIISHDLRGPFNTLLGFALLLKEHLKDYSQEEILRRIVKICNSAEKLYTLLENLLMWSQLQRGIMEYSPEELDLATIVQDNIELFHAQADYKQINLRMESDTKIVAYADLGMVNTVLRNLITNALKFTPVGGQVILTFRVENNHVNVIVADTGIGIPAERLPQLFRIDTQYTNPGTNGEQGTGLGLILCKELVEKNYGTIWAESTPGAGTTFTFTLPLPTRS